MAGQLIICAYGLTAMHSWTHRTVKMTSGFVGECQFYGRLLSKFMFGVKAVSEAAEKHVHQRRRTSLQEIASLWSLVLDLFMLGLFVVQATGVAPPMVHSISFYVTVSIGSTVMRRMGDPSVDLTPERLNRDMTVMSLLVFGATIGMPRELMPACYMARTLCFTFTNSQFSNKVNIMLAPFYVMSHWLNFEPGSPPEKLLFSMIGEVVAVSLMILVVTNLDTKEHHAAVATMELEAKVAEVAEAERTGGAAQRLLSVTCDASVRLTHDLKIKTPSRSLLDLLMCNFGSNCTTQLEGMAFLRYVVQGEHERFMKFIDENSQSTSPARSLPIDLKDSSGVTFKAELFHVTVPSLLGDGAHEHLIGITNDLADDRLGRMEHTLENLPAPSFQGLPMISEVDPRYQGTRALSHSFAPSQRHSCGKSSVSSSNSSKSSRAQLSTMREISEIDLVIDLETVDTDFRILSVTLHFAAPTSCAEHALPNLVEWLKPRYRQQVHNWIQEHANAHYAGREYKEPLRGIKLISPFPNTSTLLAGELKCKGITEEEDSSSDADESSAAGMLMEISIRQLFVH
ncbi:unnamed protein product [Symbiodinium sp. CCMP2456]|nr:unnamed protein product [Symbiodinium sp. CCMP2456]